MNLIKFETKVEEKQPVDIGGIIYNLPSKMTVEEMALMLKMFSASKTLEDDNENPQAYTDMANGLLMINDLFLVYNSPRKMKKLRLSQETAMEIFTSVYQKNE